MICQVCHRLLTGEKAIKQGMGDVCARKMKAAAARPAPKFKLEKHYADGSRTWKVFSFPPALVLVLPTEDGREANCSCDFYEANQAKCEHIELIAGVDAEMFLNK